MTKSVSSNSSSTKNNNTTKTSTNKQESITTPSLPSWKPLKSVNELKVGDLCVYDGFLSKITFIDSNYVVITPKTMQYGICCSYKFIEKILILQ